MSSQPDPSTQHSGGFFSWIRGLGVTRSSDRWLAGVAGGLAARAGIDPLIVRGIFTVLAIVGGPALLLYVAGWLLLPQRSGRIHLEDIVRGRADTNVVTIAVIAAVAVVLPLLFFNINSTGIGLGLTFGSGSWGLWEALGLPEWLSLTLAWLFWVAVIVAAAFGVRHLLIKRGQGQNTQSAQSHSESTSHQGADAPMPDTGTGTDEASSTNSTNSANSANSTDDAGTSPDWAQHLTDQATRLGEKAGQWGQETGERVDAWSVRLAEGHEARKLGAGHVLITLAFALLAAGAAAYTTLQSGFAFSTPGTTVAAFAAPLVVALMAAVAVLALSLIVAGARGRHTGFIGFLSFCGIVALLVTAVLPWGMRFQPLGEMQADSSSAPGVVNLLGNVELDLGDLDQPAHEAVDLEIWQLAGDVNVALPTSAPTVVEVRMLAGSIQENFPDQPATNFEDRSVSGPFISRTIGVNLPPRDTADTASNTSHVTIYVAAGTVEVSHPDQTEMNRILLKETNS